MGEKIRELGAVTVGPGVRMLEFVGEFLAANPGDVTNRWLKETRTRLWRAVQFFGTDRDLKTIRPREVREWLDRFLHLSASNQRHHLHALSSLYRYAQELEAVPVVYNPVSGLYRKPSAAKTRQRTDELVEIDAAAELLDAAIRLNQYPEVFAAFLLTGGRRTASIAFALSSLPAARARDASSTRSQLRSLKSSYS